MELSLVVNNVRNIKSANITLPLNKGLYALVGENGAGKSTIMLLLSLMIKTSSAHLLTSKDTKPDSSIVISNSEKMDTWVRNKALKMTTGKYDKTGRLFTSVHYHGFYEGSIFYGSRFNDYNRINEFFSKPNFSDFLIDADQFVSKSLGFILHDNESYYNGLKRIKNRTIAEAEGFKGTPYFYQVNDTIISQFQMSSGESMLLSLIDFINNLVMHGRYKKLLFLIDEVELALHPAAIDRLSIFLNKLIEGSSAELVVYFSTHSAELIHRISPKHIFLIENTDGVIEVINPCYPNYAIRNLYIPNGFDFVILVEDELAKALVSKAILENHLSESKLCCILPAGGWSQMIKLHHDMVMYNTLGEGKRIISIYDGDAETFVSKKKEYSVLPKGFLPIPSIEKYLKKKMIDEPDRAFVKRVGDNYFSIRSLSEILRDYQHDPRTATGKDNDGKNLYKILCSNLEKQGISEERFVDYLASDIFDYEKPTSFIQSLTRLME